MSIGQFQVDGFGRFGGGVVKIIKNYFYFQTFPCLKCVYLFGLYGLVFYLCRWKSM